MIQKRGINKTILLILGLLIITSLGFALTNVTGNEPTNGQNVTGSIVLNASTTGNAENVTFYFYRLTATESLALATIIRASNTTAFVNTSFDTTALADGRYNVTVNATNASNVVVSSFVGVVAIDNNAPTVFLSAPTNNTNVTTTTPSFVFNYTDAVYASNLCQVYVNGTLYVTNNTANFTSVSYTNYSLGQGSNSWQVNCTDSVGLVGTGGVSYITVDTQGPQVTITAPTAGANLSSQVIDLTATVLDLYSEVASVVFNVSNSSNQLTFTAANSAGNTWNTTLDLSTLVEGTITIQAVANDTNGFVNQTESVTITYDATSPVVTLVTGNNTNTTDNTANFTFNFTDAFSATASCTVYVAGTPYGTNAAVANATNTDITANATIADNTYAWYVNCTDNAGNVDMSDIYQITIDTAEPSVTSFESPANNADLSTGNVDIVINVTDAGVGLASVTFNVTNGTNNDVVLTADFGAGQANASFNASQFVEADHTITAVATDALGLVNNTQSISITIDRTAPTVNAVSPANLSNTSSSSEAILINFTDALSATANCVVQVDGTLYYTNTSLANNTNLDASNSTFADGTRTWSANCTDGSGNVGTTGVLSFTVDTLNPSVTAINTPSNGADLSTGTIVLNATITDGGVGLETVLFNITNGSSPFTLTATNPGGNNWNASLDLSTVTEGSQTITVKALDGLNNVNQTESVTVTVDRTSPTVAISAPVNNTNTSTTSPTFTFTSTDALYATTSCLFYVDGSLVYTNTTTQNGTATSHANVTFADGAHNYTVNCTDSASNIGVSGLYFLTVDTVAPSVTAINTPVNNANLTGGTIVINATVTDATLGVDVVRFNISNGSNSIVVVASTPGANHYNASFDVSTLAEGQHNITVLANDTLGQLNNTQYITITKDSAEPVVSINYPTSGLNLSASTIVLNATVTDAGIGLNTVTFNVTNGSNMVQFTASNGGGNDWNASLDLSTLAQGSHTFTVIATDLLSNVNNTESTTFTFDSVAPTVNFESPANNSLTSDTTPSLVFNYTDALSADADCIVSVDNSPYYTNNSVINFTSTTVVNGTLSEGAHNWSVSCTDNAGNVGGSGLFFFTVDTIAPTVSITTPSNGADLSTGTIVLNATVTDANSVSTVVFNITNGTSDVQVTASNPGGNFWNASIDISTISEGDQTILVVANDSLNQVNNTVSVTVSVDRTGPTVSKIAPVNNANVTTATPTFSFNSTDALSATSSCITYLNGTKYYTNTTVPNGTTVTQTNTSIGDGVYTWQVNCTDLSGNSGSESTFALTVDTTVPAVSLNYPTTGLNLTTSTIVLNATVTDVTIGIDTVRFNVTNGSETIWLTASNGGGNDWNASLDLSTLAQGAHGVTVYANDSVGNLNNSVSVTFTYDSNAPSMNGQATVYDDTDSYFVVGDTLNMSVNITDAVTAVRNVTFNLGNVCSGQTTTVTSTVNGLYWANCTVDANLEFEPVNITMTTCDVAGNCNVNPYHTVVVYNFTRPINTTAMWFDTTTTTDLSSETDLNDVEYRVGVFLNGTQLPGQPWNGFQYAAYLNFTTINFTDSTVQTQLSNLQTALSIIVRDGTNGAYGGSRIFVNDTAFAALNTATTVRLYNIPFTNVLASNVINDTGGTGGITGVTFSSNGDGTGNLTFNVAGFSGYNVSDSIAPATTINSPLNASAVSAFTFNATFNGTGTEIDTSDVNLTLTSISGTYYYNYSNMTCQQTANNELLSCEAVLSLADGTYNYSIQVWDFGGADGNNRIDYGNSIVVDTTNPNSTVSYPFNNSWTNDNTPTFNFTVTDNVDTNINYTVFVNGVSNITGNTSNGTNTQFTLGTLSDGVYTILVEAMDDVNRRVNSTPVVINVDTTRPNGTITSPLNNTWTTNTTQLVKVNVSDNLDTSFNYTVVVNGVQIGQNGTFVVGINNISVNLSEGNNTITFWYNDTAANTVGNGNDQAAYVNVLVDTTAPNSTISSPANNTFTSNTTPQITFTLTDNMDTNINYTVFIDGNSNVTGNVSNATATNLVLQTLSEGSHTVVMEALDEAGQRTNSTPLTIVIDTVVPNVTISSPSNNSFTNDNSTEFTFTLTDALSTTLNYTIYVNGTANGTGSTTNGTATSYNLSEKADGVWLVHVEAIDQSGNRFNSSVVNMTIDTVNPTITAFTISDTTVTRNTALSYTCSATDDATTVSTAVTGTSTAAVGTFTATCTATDAAGNTATSTQSYTVRSSGGSSGGSSSYTPPNPQKTSIWQSLGTGEIAVMKVQNSDLGISEISLKVLNAVNDVRIKVEKLSGAPASITKSIEGRVYQYIQISPTNVDASNIDGNVAVKFQVSKQWLSDLGISEDKVVLIRFTDDWVELPTNVIKSDDNFVYFEGFTPGFSYFAIGESSAVEEPVVEEPVVEEVVEEPVEETVTEEVVETTPEPVETTEEVQEDNYATIGLIALVIVVLIIIAASMHGGRKKSSESGGHHHK